MQAHELIEGFEAIIGTFGVWPSFHDAEVRQLSLEVTDDPSRDPIVDLIIHGWTV